MRYRDGEPDGMSSREVNGDVGKERGVTVLECP